MSNRYDDLVLHLNLDDIDISTSTTPDSSKSGLKAKVSGASLVEDDTFGACLSFQGQDDHVEVSSVNLTDTNPPHTIEGWIKMETYPQARAWILLLGQEGVDSHHWLLGDALGKKAQLGAWGKTANQATSIMPVGEWVHVATTHDGSNLVCYLNGQPVDKKTATFKLTDKRLTLAKRGVDAEKNFQGKMAHVRIYRRALSEAEIREDMDTDKLALPVYRRGHPIAFSLRDEDENYVLYIGDDPRDHHRLNLELRNTSAQIRFKKGEKAADKASEENHHFELVFRNGVLSDKTLKKLRENKEDVISKDAKEQWDLFCPPSEDSQTGTISVYFLYKDTSKLFGPNTRLVIPLRNISANAGSGARGTRVELKLNQLTYVDETTPITGSRIQHLQIISHLGSRRVPLHVGFVGSNRILNDGSSANTLVLQLMNVLKSEGDTSGTYTTLTSAFTMPAVNGTAVASVASGGAAQFNVGRIVYIPPIGYLNVTAVNTASNQLTLQNLGYSVNQAPGSVAPSGNTLLTKDSESSVTLTHDSEFLISFDVQSASEDAPWSLCTEREIEGVKGSIIVAKTDGRYVVIDQNGNPVSDDGRWKVDSTGHGQGETPVWSIKPLQDIVLGHDDYIQIYISKIKTSLPSGLTNLYLDYRRIPGFWDGQVVCPIEKAPLLFYDVRAIGDRALTFSVSQRVRDYIARGKLVLGPDFTLSNEAIATVATFLIQKRQDLEMQGDQAGLAEIDPLVNEIHAQMGQPKWKQLQYTSELRVGIGCVKPVAKLEIALSAKDADTKPLIIRKDNVNYLTVLKDGYVGIGKSKEEPKASLDVNGEIRANYFRAFEGATERFSVGSDVLINSKVGIGTPSPENQLHVGPGSSSIAPDRVNVVVASQSSEAGIAIAQKDKVNVLLQAAGAGGYLGTTSKHPLALKTNNEDRLVVDADGKVGIGTSSPGAKLSIMGGLHVGGESDPGDKNLLVDGRLAVNGDSGLKGPLTVKSAIRLQSGDNDPYPAAIAVEPDALEPGHSSLFFKTWQGGWVNKMVIYPNGQVCIGVDRFTPQSKPPYAALTVGGNISEQLPVIDVRGDEGWTKPDHPIMKYFRGMLQGKPVGTMLRAITNRPGWEHHYWDAWVDWNGNIPVAHNYPLPDKFAWKKGVVYAD
jgi:concanavalin A-like lectin/glucanase superfamily protein